MSTTSTVRSRRSSLISHHHVLSKVLVRGAAPMPSKHGPSAYNTREARGSQSLNTKPGPGTTAGEEESQGAASKTTETIHFVYSMAVVRALKHDYHVTIFGPPSAPPKKPQPVFEVARLPELYSDFQLVSSLVESNQRYARQLQRQLEAAGQTASRPESIKRSRPESIKLPRISSRRSSINSSKRRNVGTEESGVRKLPPIT